MDNPLTRKLGSIVDLSIEDRVALDGLQSNPQRKPAGTHLIREGERPECVFLLIEGWACRYTVLPDGRRQIMAVLIPGDLCDEHVFILDRMDHSIALLGEASFVAIPKQSVIDLTNRSPAITRGLWWSTLVDEAVLRHWLVNIAQRDAYDRIAHLFCELWERMNQVGLITADTFAMPLTQEQLGDTIGLTPVHTNRVLQRMRADGLITLQAKQLTIHDIGRMRAICRFNPQYLHLKRVR